MSRHCYTWARYSRETAYAESTKDGYITVVSDNKEYPAFDVPFDEINRSRHFVSLDLSALNNKAPNNLYGFTKILLIKILIRALKKEFSQGNSGRNIDNTTDDRKSFGRHLTIQHLFTVMKFVTQEEEIDEAAHHRMVAIRRINKWKMLFIK